MRLILAILLTIFTIQSFASEINCYSNKTRIYHGFGTDFIYSQYFLAFTEYKTGHLIAISADCIVLTPINSGDEFSASIVKEEV